MQTFVFADLAGYTALTEAMGDETAVEVVSGFFRSVEELLPAGDGELVKTIGDAAMLRLSSPSVAIELGLDIVEDLGARHGLLAVRAGMHSGPAVGRDGDWFGATVNIAARVAALAGGGEVLLTEPTRESAGELDGVQLTERGSRELKNVGEPVTLYSATRGERAQPVIDPVCRMVVEPGGKSEMLVHEGVEYHFCSLACVGEFARGPERFVS